MLNRENLIPAENKKSGREERRDQRKAKTKTLKMEEELKSLSKSLGGFCNHLQTSCDAFNHSLQRRPIPLGLFLSLFFFSSYYRHKP